MRKILASVIAAAALVLVPVGSASAATAQPSDAATSGYVTTMSGSNPGSHCCN